jgi:hypothetical protein
MISTTMELTLNTQQKSAKQTSSAWRKESLYVERHAERDRETQRDKQRHKEKYT